MFETYRELYQQASATLFALVVMSVLALGVGLERLFSTWSFRRRMLAATQHILQHLRDGKHTMAQAVNVSLPWHPATPLFELLLGEREIGTAEIRRVQGRVMRRARRRLWMLGSIGAIAPFVGLFGTVLGVMEAFHAIGEQGTGGFQVVSAGISEALVTTAAGIFVGVEAVVLFNYLQVYIGEYAAELRESVEEIIEAQTSEVKHGVSSAQAG